MLAAVKATIATTHGSMPAPRAIGTRAITTRARSLASATPDSARYTAPPAHQRTPAARSGHAAHSAHHHRSHPCVELGRGEHVTHAGQHPEQEQRAPVDQPQHLEGQHTRTSQDDEGQRGYPGWIDAVERLS